MALNLRVGLLPESCERNSHPHNGGQQLFFRGDAAGHAWLATRDVFKAHVVSIRVYSVILT